MPAPEAQADTRTKEFIMLDEVNVQIARLYRLMELNVPEGVDEEETLTVNRFLALDADAGRQNFNTRLRGPWMSITLTNDGPDSILYKLNYTEYQGTLRINETRTINMVQRGKIRRVEITAIGIESVRFSGVR
jgi:hypothetical protein